MKYLQYLKQACYLMRQQRFFSSIYIVGTGLAISMVMVLAVVYHIRTANIRPEVHRDRTVYLDAVKYRESASNSQYNSACGAGFVKEVIETLQTPEAVAVAMLPSMQRFMDAVYIQPKGTEKVLKIDYKPCNAAFWRVYDFHFLEGKPFTEEDFRAELKRVVLSRSLARKLFGKTAVVGEEVLLNDIPYTICGIVEDVSAVLSDTYSEAYFPYTTLKNIFPESNSERAFAVGVFQAQILLKKKSDLPQLQAELDEAVKRFNTMLVAGKVEVQPAYSRGFTLMGVSQNQTYLVAGLFLLLFLLVPALNISGLNASHIQDRLEEIGVRKAFGAPSHTLFVQIFVENMVLMLPGGVLGLIFSYGLVYLFRGILLSNDMLMLLTGTGENFFLSAGMLLNWRVFLYAFLVCLLLNLLSSLIPVWRAVRQPAADALQCRTC